MSTEEKQNIMQNPLNQPKRIKAFDFLRGFAIMVVIFVHRIHYTWTGMQSGDDLFTDRGFGVIIIIFTIGLFMMAGVFYVVSSTVNTYNFFQRVSKEPSKIKNYTLIGIKSGLWLILLNYLQRIFFMNGFTNTVLGVEPEYPIGIITSLVKYKGSFTWFWSIVAQTGTLFVLGINLVIISSILYILFKDTTKQDLQPKLRLLYILATIFFILSAFVKFWGTPYYDQLYNQGNYFMAYLIGGITTEFSLFPYLSFGLFGSYFGLIIASQENIRDIVKKFRKSILIWFIIGLIGIVIFDSETALGDRLMKTSINCAGVALFLLFELICLRIYEFKKNQKRSKKEPRTKGIITFGKLSLTIYILEPLLAELLILPIDLIFGVEWKNSIWIVSLFGMLCITVWMIITYIWKKNQFIGSFEWVSKKLLKKTPKILA